MENVGFGNLAVIILAAGQGKRMNDASNSKVMVSLAGKPLIHHVLDKVIPLKPKEIYLIIGHQKQTVIDYVNLQGFNVKFVEQKEQLGTGHAVKQVEPYLKDFQGDVLILCGDVPNLSKSTLHGFITFHNIHQADVTVLTVTAPNPNGYGRIIRDSKNEFLRIVEETEANADEKEVNEINSGVYIVKAELLFRALNKISNENAQGEYYLTDIIEVLHSEGSVVKAFIGGETDELLGVNSYEDLRRAEEYYKKII